MTVKEELAALRKELKDHVLADERVIAVMRDEMDNERQENRDRHLENTGRLDRLAASSQSMVTLNTDQLTLLQNLTAAFKFSKGAGILFKFLVGIALSILGILEALRHLKN